MEQRAVVQSWEVYLGEINVYKYPQSKHTIWFGNKNEEKIVAKINIFNEFFNCEKV